MSERDGAQILLPVPPSLGEPPLIRQRKPDVVYVYRDIDEGLLGYVLRWEARKGEHKTFLPATAWRGEDGIIRWRTKSWPKPAPLYHLDHLALDVQRLLLL